MTGTCILCGTLLTAEPDPILDAQRDERTMGKLGALMKQHVDRSHMQGPVQHMAETGSVTPAQLIGMMGICAQMVVVQSFFESTDPAFLVNRAKLLDVVTRAMQPKQKPLTIVTTPSGPVAVGGS